MRLKNKVNQLKKAYKIKGTPTPEQIIAIIENNGFSVHTFQDKAELYSSFCKSTPELATKEGFAIQKGDSQYVMYNKLRSKSDITIILAHECGHVMLGHLATQRRGINTPIYNEMEACTFAWHLIGEQWEKRGFLI